MMIWKEYREKFGFESFKDLMDMQYSYLDKIDFIPYLNRYEDLDDVWDEVGNDYDNSEITKNEFLCGFIFNHLDHNELKTYLEKRYNIKYHEEVITKYYRQPGDITYDNK